MSDPSDPTPERPGMDDASEAPESEQSEGQVSEVGRLDEDEAHTPLQPSDSTAGYPESESGAPDTRGSGPDSVPPENRRDNDFKSRGRQPGERIEEE